MAQKEVKVKITVYNKELEVTRQELEELNKQGHITNEVFTTATKTFDEFSDSAGDAAKETESLASQIGKVEDKMGELILAGKQNTKEFRELQKESRKLKDAQETMQITSQKSLDTFAAMPGPIGLIGKTFKDLSVTAKLAKTGLQSMGLGFNTLGKAIISSGVGAIVVLFGLLAAAVVKALSSFKPLQAALDRFKVLFEVLGKVIEPIVDMIGTALVAALDALAYAMAFVTGSLDEYNKALADSAAAEAMNKSLEKQKRDLELLGDTYDEQTKKQVEAEIAKNERLKELREDDTKDAAQKAQEKKMIEERYQRDIAAIQKEAEDKQKEERKKAYEEWKKKKDEQEAIEKDYQNRLLTLQNEFALMSLDSDFEKQRTQLEQQKKAFEKEVEELKVSESKKQQLRDQYNQNYLLKLSEVDEKETEFKATKEKERQEILNKIREAGINTEAELRQKSLDDAAKFYDDAIALAKQYGVDTLELERSKEEALAELRQKYIDEDQKRKDDADQADRDRKAAMVEYEQTINMAVADIAMNLAGVLAEVAGENKGLQKAAVVIGQAASIAQIVAQTAIANAKAVAAFPLTGGQPWVTINSVSAGVSIAGVIAATVKAIKQIDGSDSGGGTGGGGGQNLGRNYERGGMIRGRRHAQGGVMLEAEGGEAIMNRNSVAMFGPMLSMMNQMGGGVSFSSDVSQPAYDNPKTTNYGQDVEGSIIKTYVVEQELTTAQQRQARLKELSTL